MPKDYSPRTGAALETSLKGEIRSLAPVVANYPYAATVTIDASLGGTHRVNLTGDVVIAVPANPAEGQTIVIELTAVGATRAVTLASGSAGSFKFLLAPDPIAAGTTTCIMATFHAAGARWWVLASVGGF